MRLIKYVPNICKGENPPISGHIMLMAPTFDQRFEYVEQAGFEIDEDGNFKAGMKQVPAIRKLVSLTKEHYKEVALKKADGTELKSYEDLIYDPECDQVLSEVSMAIVNGLRPSKN